jgi:hypothetical protein
MNLLNEGGGEGWQNPYISNLTLPDPTGYEKGVEYSSSRLITCNSRPISLPPSRSFKSYRDKSPGWAAGADHFGASRLQQHCPNPGHFPFVRHLVVEVGFREEAIIPSPTMVNLSLSPPSLVTMP